MMGKHTLVSFDPSSPFSADLFRIDHDVDFHRVEPRLSVLISIALNSYVTVCDQQLDVTAINGQQTEPLLHVRSITELTFSS